MVLREIVWSGGGVKSHRFDGSSPSYSDLKQRGRTLWFRSGQNTDADGLRRIRGIAVAEIEFNRRAICGAAEIQVDRRW